MALKLIKYVYRGIYDSLIKKIIKTIQIYYIAINLRGTDHKAVCSERKLEAEKKLEDIYIRMCVCVCVCVCLHTYRSHGSVLTAPSYFMYTNNLCTWFLLMALKSFLITLK